MTTAPLDTEAQTQTLPDVPKWTGYLSCYDCPFEVFLECLLENKYDRLITSGEATQTEKTELFLALYSEYHVLCGNTAMTAVLLQVWQRNCLRAKVRVIKHVLAFLAEQPDEQEAEVIRLFGYHLPVYNGDTEEYSGHLNRIAAQIKGLEHQAKQIDDILASLQGDELTKATFMKQFVYLSKHNGFRLTMKDITVAEYCAYLKEYTDEQDRLQAQLKQDGGSD